MSVLIHNSIDTTYVHCVHISMIFFQICVKFCIDVVVVVEINSIQIIITGFPQSLKSMGENLVMEKSSHVL